MEQIQKVMDERGVVYTLDETEEHGILFCPFRIENGPASRVVFISCQNRSDIGVRLYEFIGVSKEKIETILPVINDINNDYRYVKFVVDTDGSVQMEYDFPEEMDLDTLGNCCFEIFVRFMQIADECYARIMKTIWGDCN